MRVCSSKWFLVMLGLTGLFGTTGSVAYTQWDMEASVFSGLARAQERQPVSCDTPRISSPQLVEIDSNHFFRYQIVATGKRPIKFTAYQLPKGLLIDEETGLIIGSLTQPGRYYVVVRADNEFGGDFRRIQIEVARKPR